MDQKQHRLYRKFQTSQECIVGLSQSLLLLYQQCDFVINLSANQKNTMSKCSTCGAMKGLLMWLTNFTVGAKLRDEVALTVLITGSPEMWTPSPMLGGCIHVIKANGLNVRRSRQVSM